MSVSDCANSHTPTIHARMDPKSTMSDNASNIDAAGSVSMEEFESMKREFELVKSRCNMHDNQARQVLTSMQPEVSSFLSDMAEGEGNDAQTDLEPMMNWSKDFHTHDTIDANLRLAKAFVRCSAKYKRVRELCSAASAEKDLLANTLKENDELKSKMHRLEARSTELQQALGQTQSNCAELAKVVEDGERMLKSTDFSHLGSREVTCASAGGAEAAGSKLNESRAIPGLDDALFKLVSRNGIGDSRLRPSASSHSILGGLAPSVY